MKKTKLICFDLDGVMTETKMLHYEAFNKALNHFSPRFHISLNEHYTIYDGLPTKEKIKLLNIKKGFPIDKNNELWKLKQQFTQQMLDEKSFEQEKEIFTHIFSYIKSLGIQIYVCSNSIKNTTYQILDKLNVLSLVDGVLTNEDVKNPKPSPEIYLTAMVQCGVSPIQTIVFEDSPHGIRSAQESGAKCIIIKSPFSFSKEMISHIIEHHNKTTHFYPNWKDEDLHIVIPMAGWGSRFTKVGYEDPKPLIKIFDKPMIELVVKSLHIQANIIFIVRKEHRNQYNLDYFLKYITHNNCHIIETEKVTEGAACTVLLAENLINNDKQLLIVNSDQYIKWDSINFMYKNISNPLLDGSILTFEDNSNKWSYVRLNDQNLVEEVREKEVISNKATVGIYYWKKGKDFVKYAKQMIEKNIRVNNEFYVAPVYNEAIQDGKHIFTYDVEEMWGLGTPEDLEYFLKHKSYEDL